MLFRDPIKICSSSTHATQLGVCTTLVGLPHPAVIRKLSSLGCPPSLYHGPTVFSTAAPRCFLLTSLQLAFSPSQSYSFQIGIGGVAIPANYQDFSISFIFLHTTSREGKYEIMKHVDHIRTLFSFLGQLLLKIHGLRLNFFPCYCWWIFKNAFTWPLFWKDIFNEHRILGVPCPLPQHFKDVPLSSGL